MFGFIKKQLQKIYTAITTQAGLLFARPTVDTDTLLELEKILIAADTGAATSRAVIKELAQEVASGKITKGSDLKKALEQKLVALVSTKPYSYDADVFLLVGINGSGKTTCAGKLGYLLTQKNKKLLFAAGDTFRAAATEQLEIWANRCGGLLVKGKENQDPSSVIYQACTLFGQGDFDALIIDTAGRLQVKVNLMKELEKIKKTVEKLLPNKKITTLLTIDSMLGQNSLEQARLFYESTTVDGIIVTKLDGTGKGGIVISIIQQLGIPVAYVSYGERADQFSEFDASSYVKDLF